MPRDLAAEAGEELLVKYPQVLLVVMVVMDFMEELVEALALELRLLIQVVQEE